METELLVYFQQDKNIVVTALMIKNVGHKTSS